MKTESKYVLIYCDRCELMAGVIKLLLQMYPNLEVKTASDVSDLLLEIDQKLPEYILVYMVVHNESYISIVKSIRESVNTTETPVIIYQALPDETELRKLSHRIN